MFINPHLIKIQNIALLLFFFCLSVFAAEPKTKASQNKEDSLSDLQKQAREYRFQGYQLQRMGDMENALGFYQKAIEIDPSYAPPYNDLGVIYEAGGSAERAEQAYLRAIKIDPYFLSAYSNLALLYENQRDLNKAVMYWKKRVDFGDPNDPWTQRARRRANDISLMLSGSPVQFAREKRIISLTRNTWLKKDLERKDNKAMSREDFVQAKVAYNKGDYAAAFRKSLDAQYLDPANEDIENFIDKVQERALTR